MFFLLVLEQLLPKSLVLLPFSVPKTPASFNFSHVTKNEIMKDLISLETNKATSLDRINIALLKQGSKFLSIHFQSLSLSSSKVPKC